MAECQEIMSTKIDAETTEPPEKKAKLDADIENTETITDVVAKTNPEKEEETSTVLNKQSKKQFRGAVVETDVGITEYVGNFKGFTGIIKQRYSDFLVNEIDLQGQVVRLTDISNPEKSTQSTDSKAVESPVLTEEWKSQLQKLLDEKNSLGKVELLCGDDKKVRSEIHAAIRQNYPGLDSSTGQKDGVKCITVVYKPHRSKDERQRDPWPPGRGDYCHFVMYKENKDTADSVGLLAKMLRLKPSMFTFAGSKDKRGKTCQCVSVYRVPGSRLHQLNKGLRGIALGNFRYEKEPLRLGDLKGNHFVIVLRSLGGEQSDIDSSLESLRDKGFINYFGLQRFGTTSVPTHQVGKTLLLGQWADAIDLILQPRDGDADDLSEARATWAKTKDAGAALSKIRRQSIEKTLLIGLKKHKSTDYIGALSELPRNTRLMYVHAYQSYIWNVVASRRIREFGLKVMEGDLVLKHNKEKLTSAEKEPVVVTSEILNDVSIHDVVLPLPGWDIMFPTNITGQWYTELLKEDGLTQTDLKNKVKDYSLPGDYRHLVIKPGTVEWRVLQYEDPTQSLVLSDFEKLKEEHLPEPEGNNKALRLELSLPSSVYATMALREVLRSDTSACHQASLNQ